MVDLFFNLDLRLEILYSFADENVVAPLRNTDGANAYNALVTALSMDIVRDLYAMILDKAEETLSVKNVWRLVQRPIMMSELRRRCDAMGSEQAAAFGAAFHRLGNAVPELIGSDRAKWLTEVRHTSVAHREMRVGAVDGKLQVDVRNLSIDRQALRDCLGAAQPIVEDLGFVATATERNWRLYRNVHQVFAADFWSRLQGRGPSTISL